MIRGSRRIRLNLGHLWLRISQTFMESVCVGHHCRYFLLPAVVAELGRLVHHQIQSTNAVLVVRLLQNGLKTALSLMANLLLLGLMVALEGLVGLGVGDRGLARFRRLGCPAGIFGGEIVSSCV